MLSNECKTFFPISRLYTYTNSVIEINSDCVFESTLFRESFENKIHFHLMWPSLKAFTSITCDPVRNTNYAKLRDCLKVSKFQNEFMKSLFLPKYEPNIVRISALHCTVITTGQKSLQFLVHILGETMTSSIHSEIY